MRALHDLYAFGLFAGYLVTGVLMLGIFSRAYQWLTPYDDAGDIRGGKMGPAVLLSGAKLGFVIPLLAASFVGASFLDYVVWAVIAAAFQMGWFYVGFMLWRNDKVDPYNVAETLPKATGSVCVGLIQAFCMIP